MASAGVTVLESIAPEFTDDDEVNETFLEYAATLHTASEWGQAFTLAMAYFAAHLRTGSSDSTGEDATAAGSVTSKKAGDLAEGYAAPSISDLTTLDADLMTTKYGRKYLMFRGTRAATAPRVIVP